MGFKMPRIVGDLVNPIQGTMDAFKTTENVLKAKSLPDMLGASFGQVEGPHRGSDTTLLGL